MDTIEISKLKPIRGNVFVKQKIEDEKTASGIITTMAKQKHLLQSKGEIVAFDESIGEQCMLMVESGKIPEFTTRKFEIGDVAFFDNYAGRFVNIENVEYIVLKYTEIIGILNNNSTKISISGGGLENASIDQLESIMN